MPAADPPARTVATGVDVRQRTSGSMALTPSPQPGPGGQARFHLCPFAQAESRMLSCRATLPVPLVVARPRGCSNPGFFTLLPATRSCIGGPGNGEQFPGPRRPFILDIPGRHYESRRFALCSRERVIRMHASAAKQPTMRGIFRAWGVDSSQPPSRDITSIAVSTARATNIHVLRGEDWRTFAGSLSESKGTDCTSDHIIPEIVSLADPRPLQPDRPLRHQW